VASQGRGGGDGSDSEGWGALVAGNFNRSAAATVATGVGEDGGY
jgi:hypothetical protein